MTGDMRDTGDMGDAGAEAPPPRPLPTVEMADELFRHVPGTRSEPPGRTPAPPRSSPQPPPQDLRSPFAYPPSARAPHAGPPQQAHTWQAYPPHQQPPYQQAPYQPYPPPHPRPRPSRLFRQRMSVPVAVGAVVFACVSFIVMIAVSVLTQIGGITVGTPVATDDPALPRLVDLAPQTCTDDVPWTTDQPVAAVACSAPAARMKVLGVVVLDEGPFRGVRPEAAEAAGLCRARFPDADYSANYAGDRTEVRKAPGAFWPVVPSQESWDGDRARSAVCAVVVAAP